VYGIDTVVLEISGWRLEISYNSNFGSSISDLEVCFLRPAGASVVCEQL